MRNPQKYDTLQLIIQEKIQGKGPSNNFFFLEFELSELPFLEVQVLFKVIYLKRNKPIFCKHILSNSFNFLNLRRFSSE